MFRNMNVKYAQLCLSGWTTKAAAYSTECSCLCMISHSLTHSSRRRVACTRSYRIRGSEMRVGFEQPICKHYSIWQRCLNEKTPGNHKSTRNKAPARDSSNEIPKFMFCWRCSYLIVRIVFPGANGTKLIQNEPNTLTHTQITLQLCLRFGINVRFLLATKKKKLAKERESECFFRCVPFYWFRASMRQPKRKTVTRMDFIAFERLTLEIVSN